MTPMAAVGLYHRLLGTAWDDLAMSVQRLHGDGETIHATGNFCVRHGNWLARRAAWLAGLPAAGECVEVRLTVVPTSDGEEWQRSFAGRPLVSRQWASDGLLVEHLGPNEMRFRMAAEHGALVYRVAGIALRLGPLRVPLPRWCRPHVDGSESPIAGCDEVAIAVEIRLPILGLLVGYGGTLRRVEPSVSDKDSASGVA